MCLLPNENKSINDLIPNLPAGHEIRVKQFPNQVDILTTENSNIVNLNVVTDSSFTDTLIICVLNSDGIQITGNITFIIDIVISEDQIIAVCSTDSNISVPITNDFEYQSPWFFGGYTNNPDNLEDLSLKTLE